MENQFFFKKRNQFIKEFFNGIGININLLGDPEKPYFVTDANIVLSCFVKGFTIIFMDQSDIKERKELFKIKITSKPDDYKKRIIKWMLSAQHKKVYVFKANNTEMFFSHLEKRVDGIYPVFSPNKDLAYYTFKRQKAISKQSEIRNLYPKISIVF